MIGSRASIRGALRESEEDPTDFWILVDLRKPAPHYLVMPAWWIENDIYRTHHAYLDRYGGQRAHSPESKHHSIRDDRVEQWREQWSLLGDLRLTTKVDCKLPEPLGSASRVSGLVSLRPKPNLPSCQAGPLQTRGVGRFLDSSQGRASNAFRSALVDRASFRTDGDRFESRTHQKSLWRPSLEVNVRQFDLLVQDSEIRAGCSQSFARCKPLYFSCDPSTCLPDVALPQVWPP